MIVVQGDDTAAKETVKKSDEGKRSSPGRRTERDLGNIPSDAELEGDRAGSQQGIGAHVTSERGAGDEDADSRDLPAELAPSDHQADSLSQGAREAEAVSGDGLLPNGRQSSDGGPKDAEQPTDARNDSEQSPNGGGQPGNSETEARESGNGEISGSGQQVGEQGPNESNKGDAQAEGSEAGTGEGHGSPVAGDQTGRGREDDGGPPDERHEAAHQEGERRPDESRDGSHEGQSSARDPGQDEGDARVGSEHSHGDNQ